MCLPFPALHSPYIPCLAQPTPTHVLSLPLLLRELHLKVSDGGVALGQQLHTFGNKCLRYCF